MEGAVIPLHTETVGGVVIEVHSSGNTSPPDRHVGCARSSLWLLARGMWWPVEHRSAWRLREDLACCESFRDVVDLVVTDWPLPPLEAR